MSINLTSDSVERASKMSLDEYILEKGIYISSSLRQPKIDSINTRTSRIEDMDDNDNLMDDIDGILTKNTRNHYDTHGSNDLRTIHLNNSIKEENINNINHSKNLFSERNESLPPIRSQQWRLMKPNTSIINRPSGMPPLVMHDAAGPFNVLGRNRNSNPDNSGISTGKKRKNKFNKSKKKSNGNKMNTFDEFLKNYRQQNSTFKGQQLQDLSISVPADSINRNHTANPNNFQSHQIDSNVKFLQDVGTSNVISKDIIPMIAKNLLNQLQNVVIPATPSSEKYDLKVQQEIHMLQNKPFIYKCGNVEKPSILSYDGPGLHNNINPSTTGISLNQRFA